MTQPVSTPKKPRKTSTTTKIASVVLFVGLIVFLIWALTRGSTVKEYNHAIDLMNAEKYDEAQVVLEKLLQTDPPADIKQNASTELAKVYSIKGDNPSLSFTDAANWYRKADALDKTVLSEHQRSVLRTPPPATEDSTDSGQ